MIFNNQYPIDVVWLDLDDTIIDFTTNSRAALVRLYRTEGLDRFWPDAERWVDHYEKHNHSLWALYSSGSITREFLRMDRFARPLIEVGVPEADAIGMSRKFDPLYLDYLARERELMPGAMSLLRHVRSCGAIVGVLSNGFKEVQYRKMQSAGIADMIDITVLSDDIGVNKPDVRLFKYAMSRSGTEDPSRHLMIGDNASTDIAGALKTGWRAVHYLPQRNSSAVPAQGCMVRGELDEIAALLTP